MKVKSGEAVKKDRYRSSISRSFPTSPRPHFPIAAGFTLLEMLIVLGIFSTVVVIASDIFLMSSRVQRKVFGLERAQADARFLLEAMTREVRTGEIDYAYYSDRGAAIDRPDRELALVDPTGTKIRFFASDAATEGNCPDEASRPCLLVAIGADAPQPMTPKGLIVRELGFYVAPAVDPFVFDPAGGGYAADDQPRVTIVMSLEATEVRSEERTAVSAQTTVSSRKYKR